MASMRRSCNKNQPRISKRLHRSAILGSSVLVACSQCSQRGFVPPPVVRNGDIVLAATAGIVAKHTNPKKDAKRVPIPPPHALGTPRVNVDTLPGSITSARKAHAAGRASHIPNPHGSDRQSSLWIFNAAAFVFSAWLVSGGLGSLQQLMDSMWVQLVMHHASAVEDLMLLLLASISVYCLQQMFAMQMHCPHWEARMHVACNALALLCSLYGLFAERCFREAPSLWWAVAVPVLYLVSNVTMTELMRRYRGPIAYKRLFELGQSFVVSFQGIHIIGWSSVYPQLFWIVMPFWYWSLKKLIEPVIHLAGIAAEEDKEHVEARSKAGEWEIFGLQLNMLTIIFGLANFASAVVDNAYMGVYTLRGPEGLFEVSRSLEDTAGWGSDHLRQALVKPAEGSLVISLAVFIGTLVQRGKLPTSLGVPASVLLSSIGPWLVFFWHRSVDSSEPWLPEFLGDNWGPSPLSQLLG